MGQYIILTFQVLFFSGLIWSNLFHFKNSNSTNFYIAVIKIVGAVLIFDNLYLSITDTNIESWQTVIGLLLIVTASALFFWAIYSNYKEPLSFAFTHLEKDNFKKKGPYNFIRHPIYAAYTYGWIAGIILHMSWILGLLSAVMVSLYYKASLIEEETLMAGPHKTEYVHYRNRTGLYWPNLRTLKNEILS